MGVKYSQYNTLLKVNDEFGLFYNAMSDKFIILKSKAYDTLVNSDVALLQQRDTVLYSQLLEVGGIVDVDVDEVQQVRDLIHQVDDDDTVFHLHVNPTVDCNFRCWYCYENHVKGSKMSNDTCEAVKRLIDNIISQHVNLKLFQLSFFGGEPFLFFNVIARPLIEYANNVCMHNAIELQVNFTTNGYLLSNNMIKLFENMNVNFQITLDGAKEQHDKTRFMKNGHGSFDRIVRNIKFLADGGHFVILRINYTIANIASISDIINSFDDVKNENRKNIQFDFQRVWQDAGMADDENAINETIIKYISFVRRKGFVAINSRIIDNLRNSCYGDKKNYVLVNFDGNIFNCTARDFTIQNRSGYLSMDGNLIYDKTFPNCRKLTKFSRLVCHNCRIAPLCGGGCSQKAYENRTKDGCLYGYDESRKNEIIMDRFDTNFSSVWI